MSDAALDALGTWHAFCGLQQGRKGVRHGEAFRADPACGRPAIAGLLINLWRDAMPAEDLA